eukprot:COSAG02_NODE_42231_length_386_cov_0.947735_1_plen_79_part_10
MHDCTEILYSDSEFMDLTPSLILAPPCITELQCVLRTFGGVDFSLGFICGQSVSEFLWDRLRASIQLPVIRYPNLRNTH